MNLNTGLAILWSLVILVLSTLPKDSFNIEHADKIPHLDKIAHFIMYLVFTILWTMTLSSYYNKRKSVITSVVIAIFFGILMEILQKIFFTTRDFDILDILANIGGSLLGIVIFSTFELSFWPVFIRLRKNN